MVLKGVKKLQHALDDILQGHPTLHWHPVSRIQQKIQFRDCPLPSKALAEQLIFVSSFIRRFGLDSSPDDSAMRIHLKDMQK